MKTIIFRGNGQTKQSKQTKLAPCNDNLTGDFSQPIMTDSTLL